MQPLNFKKSDLLFLSKLDLNLDVTAVPMKDEENKRYWGLHVRAENNGFIQEGYLYGARGEIRRFYQLNALVDACSNYLNECDRLSVKLKE